MHNDFTLFWRKVPSGKKVVYYYAYDVNNKRRGPWTTEEVNKTAARNYCNKLISQGKLIPFQLNSPTFEEYAEGWWEWDTCKYLKKRKRHHNLAQSYADLNKAQMKNHLIPYFGNMKLCKITADDIESWFDIMAEEDYKNTYINGIFGTLKTMMIEAVERKLLITTPTSSMEKLVNDSREVEIVTQEEFNALFNNDWNTVWNGDRISYLANKLAALTGMRSSEVLGLKGGYVFEDHIFVCAQFDRYGYRPTKTKDRQNVPMTPDFIGELEELVILNGNGYVFSLDGGATPVPRKSLYDDLHAALMKIGISREEISERNLHLHAWRHFCNTRLLDAGVPLPKVQAVIRHKSERMTNKYTHFNPNEFVEVRKAQEALLHPEENKTFARNRSIAAKVTNAAKRTTKKSISKTTKPAKQEQRGKIIKMPDRNTGKIRKQA
jgi:integrase